jgi:hypothetical protein
LKKETKLGTIRDFLFSRQGAPDIYKFFAEARNWLGSVQLYHPTHSSVPVPRDHNLFPKLKKNLARKSFSSNEKIQNEGKIHLREKNHNSTTRQYLI